MTSAGAYPSLKATGKCASSGRELLEGEQYIATLVEHAGEFARVDFSLAAWASGARPAGLMIVLGFWRATHQAGEVKRAALMGDAEMLDLFEELGPSGGARQVRFRYLLALLLIRRRLLRVTSTKRGSEGTVLSVVRRGESDPGRTPVDVVDPGMDDASIVEALDQLTTMMEGGEAKPAQA